MVWGGGCVGGVVGVVGSGRWGVGWGGGGGGGGVGCKVGGGGEGYEVCLYFSIVRVLTQFLQSTEPSFSTEHSFNNSSITINHPDSDGYINVTSFFLLLIIKR